MVDGAREASFVERLEDLLELHDMDDLQIAWGTQRARKQLVREPSLTRGHVLQGQTDARRRPELPVFPFPVIERIT